MEQMLAGIAGMADTFMLEWLAAVVLILIAVAMSLFDLPGNTLMVGCCLGFAFYDPAKYFDIRIISAVILIYALGEIWEFVLSFFGIKRQVRSISWWGVFLIGCGTFVGTVMGTTAFPVAGSVIGGAIGAFAMAYLYEYSRSHNGHAGKAGCHFCAGDFTGKTDFLLRIICDKINGTGYAVPFFVYEVKLFYVHGRLHHDPER